MKMPKKRRTYCAHCNKHTVHEVLKVKKKKASELKAGQRRFRRITSGYGGFPRPTPSHEKATKRINIKLKCSVCGKQHSVRGVRLKKFEIVES